MFKAVMFCTTSLLALAQPAFGQTVANPANPGPLPGEATADDAVQTTAPGVPSPLPSTSAEGSEQEGGQAPDIVVTGSRISRKDYTAESPIVTVGKSFVENSGTPSLEQAINQLPQFTASSGGQTAGGGSTGASRAGARATLDLRGLGIARTLVLLDGRRLVPSDPLGAVDLNTISAALIEGVETITGGASAVYGSDAVAGVVNFQLKKNFTGVQLDGEAGISDRGDAATYNLAATYGAHVLDDRLHVLASASYFNRGTAARRSRPFFDDILGNCCYTTGLIVPDGTNLVSQAALNTVFRGYGTAVPTRASSLSVNADRTVFGTSQGGQNLRYGSAEGFIVSNTGAVSELSRYDATLQSPLDRYTGFVRTEFDVTASLSVYAQVNYAQYTSDFESENGVLQATTTPIRVRADNPFVPADLRTLLASRPSPTAAFNYYFTGTRASRLRFRQEYDVAQVLGGVKGRVEAIDGSYDLYASYGRSRQDESTYGYLGRAEFNSLVNGTDAAGVPDGGRSRCEGGYDLFSQAPISQSCIDYLVRPTLNRSLLTQTVVEGTLQGRIAELPAGELRFAAGADYRKNGYDYRADPLFESATSTSSTGTTIFSPAAVLGTSGASSGGGSTEVVEAFGELLIPLIHDTPLIRSLNLDLAYRFSHYDTVGSVHTYKAGADWEVLPFATIRGGYSRAIRAPSVGELFGERRGIGSAIGTVASGGGDPCDYRSAYRAASNPARDQVRDLCVALGVPAATVDSYVYNGNLISGYQSGNTALKEETADSYTIGLVLAPKLDTPIFSSLSASIDYYNVNLKDAIGFVTAAVSFQRCFNADGASNPSYSPTDAGCTAIVRDSAGLLAYSTEPQQNLSGYKVSGIDAQIDWRIDLAEMIGGSAGALSTNAVVSWLDEFAIQSTSSRPFVDYAGTIGNGQVNPFAISHPEWKATTTVTYLNGPASLSFRWRFIDKMRNATTVGTSLVAPGVESRSYYDLIGRVAANRDFDLRFGVTNLFDTAPPTYTGNGAVDASTYDVIQRRFFVGFTSKF